MADQTPKIMVVDDDPVMLASICDILEFEGYDVTPVEDGYQAIAKATAEIFGLIFMDINLPGIDGVQAYRKIKEISPGTVVIMMTGFSVEDLVQQAVEEGAFTVLYKPLDIKKVLTAVQAILESACVLVVDDEADNRESLKMLLEDSGINVGLAQNGNQAISQVQERHFDIVLMDVGMPGISAFDACQEIVAIDPAAKVIFVTAHELEEYARQALLAGAFSLLSKPVEPDHMLTLVNSILRLTPEGTAGVSGQFGFEPE